MATTLDIADGDFTEGVFRFGGPSDSTASVVNRGTVTVADGGLAALVAPGVANEGLIAANLGQVTLASGNAFTLDLFGDGLINLTADAQVLSQAIGPDGQPMGALVANSGAIQADGGTVILTVDAVQGVVDNVINMSGVVQAHTAVEQNGEIILMGGGSGIVAVSGTLDASGRDAGETGGTVKVLGEYVGLFGGALVDVSGDAGGGTALIGGNFQGKGPEQNAERTYVDGGATINADAVTSGDGGTVIVWADEITRYFGDISARGGAISGNGGFAEVSGKEYLSFDGLVDAQAPNGNIGTLLLDPKNITVDDGGGATAVADVDQFADGGGANDATIDKDTLDALAASVTLQANNDITISAAGIINLTTSAATLTMQAGRSIIINANITTNDGAVTIVANETDGNGVQDANRDAGTAVITMLDGTTINAGNQNIVITMSTGPTTNNASGDITIEHLTTTGDVSIVNNGNIAGNSILRASVSSLITAASVALDATPGAGTTASSGLTGTPIRVLVTGGLEAIAQGGGVFIGSAGGALQIGGAVLLAISGISTTDNGDIEVAVGTGNLTFAGGAGESISANDTGDVSLSITAADAQLVTANANDDILSGGGNITSTADRLTLALGNITSTGALVLQPNNTAETIGVGNTATGDFNLDDTEAGLLGGTFSSITIGRAADGTGTVDVNAVTFADNVTIVGGAIAVTGLNAGVNTVTLTARGATAITDGDGATTLDVTGSTVTLTADTGIGATGAANSIEIDATTLSATNASSGGIFINDLGTGGLAVTANAATAGALEILGATEAVTLTNLDTANGAILVSLTGFDIIASDVVAVGATNIVLTTTTAGDITLGLVDAAGDTIDVDSAATVIEAAGTITAATLDLAGAGTLGATGAGALTTAITTLIANTAAGGVFVSQTGNLTLGAVAVGTGDVEVTTTGTLSTTAAADVTGANITLTLGVDLLLTVDANTTITATTNVTLISDEMTLASVGGDLITAGGAGVLLLRAAENLTNLKLGANAGADVSAGGAGGTLALDTTDLAALDDTSGTIQFGTAAINGATTITNSGAALTLNAALSVFSDAFGFEAAGDAVISNSTISIDAEGAITDFTGADEVTDITATTLTIADSTGVGVSAADALNLSVDNLAITTTSGNAFLTESAGITLNAVTVVNSTFDFRAITGNIVVGGNVNTTAGVVVITATADNASITSTTSTITATGVGGVSLTADDMALTGGLIAAGVQVVTLKSSTATEHGRSRERRG